MASRGQPAKKDRNKRRREKKAANLASANDKLRFTQAKLEQTAEELETVSEELEDCKAIAANAENKRREAERMLMESLQNEDELQDKRFLLARFNYATLGVREKARAEKIAQRLKELLATLDTMERPRWRELMRGFFPVYAELECGAQQEVVDLLYRQAELTEPPSPYGKMIEEFARYGIEGNKHQASEPGLENWSDVRETVDDSDEKSEVEAELASVQRRLQMLISAEMLGARAEKFWAETAELFQLSLRLQFHTNTECPWPRREPFALVMETVQLNEAARLAQERERDAVDNLSDFMLLA